MNNSLLNETIRDVLADLKKNDQAASNREVAEEVKLRKPDLVDAEAAVLVDQQLINRIRKLRKNGPKTLGRSAAQLTLPEMAKDLLPRLPAEIPRWPDKLAPIVATLDEVEEDRRDLYEENEDGNFQLREDALDEDEIPWGNLWTSTVAEVRRYRQKLRAGIEADQRRERAVRELLDMASKSGAGDDARIIDAVRLVPQPGP